MRSSRKIVFIMIITMQVSACKYAHMDVGWAKPPELDMEPPPGPPIYQQGFRDGCESGFSGFAASGTKLFWKWKQDPELAERKEYYQIWKDAYHYCSAYAGTQDAHGLGNWR